MSRGPSRLERAIAELFTVAKDRPLSVGDICDRAFELNGRAASRAQRPSATRAAHHLLRRAAAAIAAVETAFDQALEEARIILDREPGGPGGPAQIFLARHEGRRR